MFMAPAPVATSVKALTTWVSLVASPVQLELLPSTGFADSR